MLLAKKLIKIAQELDDAGHYKLADELDTIAAKMAADGQGRKELYGEPARGTPAREKYDAAVAKYNAAVEEYYKIPEYQRMSSSKYDRMLSDAKREYDRVMEELGGIDTGADRDGWVFFRD